MTKEERIIEWMKDMAGEEFNNCIISCEDHDSYCLVFQCIDQHGLWHVMDNLGFDNILVLPHKDNPMSHVLGEDQPCLHVSVKKSIIEKKAHSFGLAIDYDTPPIPIMKEDGEAMTEDEKREAIRAQINDDVFIKNMAEKTDVNKWSLERSNVRIKAIKEALTKEFFERPLHPLYSSIVYDIHHSNPDGEYPSSDLRDVIDSITEKALFKSSQEYREAVCKVFKGLLYALRDVDEVYCIHQTIERSKRLYTVDETN